MSKIKTKYQSLFLIILTAVSGGGIPVFSKIALKDIPPLPFTLIRFILAALVLLSILLFQKQRFGLNAFKKLFLISILGAVNVTLFVIGIRLTTASSGQMLYTLAPLFAGILSYFLLREHFNAKKIAGVLIGFLGSLIIILLPTFSGKSSLNGGLGGNLIIFIAVCAFSIYSVLSKKFQKEFSPLLITLAFALATVLIQILLMPFSFHNATWLHAISPMAIWGTLYVGIIGTGIYYFIYQLAIKSATPVIASMVLYLQPIFTILWAIGLLGEKISLWFAIGSLLAFTGIALVTLNGRKDENK